jgi:hypothetical protein
MKDKELRQILNKEGFICMYDYGLGHNPRKVRGPSAVKGKIEYLERTIDDQQEQINFMLNHLNLDIKKFKGYVEKSLTSDS